MEQPNLGKRISEIRKAKGLTQEELAEQCKINVRTLQRIETGVVTPRAYTVRVIFAALKEDRSFMRLQFENMYPYFKNLFNLKINTMKKVSILSISVLAIGLGLFALCSESNAQKVSISKYVTDHRSNGIVYLYPRTLTPVKNTMKGDTTISMFGKYLVQEFKMNIYLNEEFVGRAEEGDTIKLDEKTLFKKEKITIIKGSYAMKSLNSKNIVYIFPFNKSLGHGMKNDEYEIFIIGDTEIKEEGNKIYLNEVYQGEAFANDTVIFSPRGTLTIKSVNRAETYIHIAILPPFS